MKTVKDLTERQVREWLRTGEMPKPKPPLPKDYSG
jgi:hypothetical protein